MLGLRVTMRTCTAAEGWSSASHSWWVSEALDDLLKKYAETLKKASKTWE